MYRDAVDQVTRNDIAAAAAAHHELGRDYDGAVAESLIERIGAEIDKRVDARLRVSAPAAPSPAQVRQPGKIQAAWAGAGIGAGITGLVALIADSGSQSKAVTAAVIAVWAVLAAACLGTAVLRWYLGRRTRMNPGDPHPPGYDGHRYSIGGPDADQQN